jgi:hypothetical protein
LLAVADAVVMTAGLEAPHDCPPLNRTVQALLVVLVHAAPTGELYASVYGPSLPDPWELDSRGAASVWLWKDGGAPSLR